MQLITSSQQVLGSIITIHIATANTQLAEEAISKCFRECERVEQAYSRFLTSSDLAKLNNQVGQWQDVSLELFFLINFGLELSLKSQGAFNLSVKELLENWGYDTDYSLKPQAYELTYPTFSEDILVKSPNEVYITKQLDLGGIGKGYALDQIVNILQEFPNVFINAGGDLFVRGLNEQGKPWTVYFEHPLASDQIIGELKVSNPLFLGGSNPNKRRWADKHHLVDPITQAPAQNMLAVYTQGQSGITVDGWATALFAMGFPAARAQLESLPVSTLIISPSGEMAKSKNFQIQFYTE